MNEMEQSISIAEQFFSVQGEGPHAGTPAVFLRLAGCNLCCGGRENFDRDAEDMEPEGDATWVCDTIDVWREAERRAEPEELAREWKARGWTQALSDSAHLVLTGGEPMLGKHQHAFANFVEALNGLGVEPYVEVETNGTKTPEGAFDLYVDHFNVSLKLSNSGMDTDERLNQSAIEFFRRAGLSNSDVTSVFKFVVSGPDDVEEIEWIQDKYGIPDSLIMLMPAGQTQDQLRETYEIVAEQCKEQGWQFSPRLQVDTWGQVTGV